MAERLTAMRLSASKKLSCEDTTHSKKSIDRIRPPKLEQKRNRQLLPLPDIRSPAIKQTIHKSPSRNTTEKPPLLDGIPSQRRKNSSNCKSKGKIKVSVEQLPKNSAKASTENIICGGLPLVIDSPKQFPQIMEENPLMKGKKQVELERREEEQRRNILQLSPKKIFSKDRNNIFQRWRIGQMIGAGSTSEVYKVFDTNTGRFVAGKKIIMFDEPELSKSIKSELDILCGLEHPNIVRFYDHSHHHGDIWFFMEYLPETLEMVYRNYGKITEETARAYTKQLVSAVKYLHSNKIIHKDIKCSNVLISSEGVLKLSDFGSSKKFDQTNSVAAYNVNGAMTFKGSVLWMAPEVIRQNKYGRKSDIWSLGCTVLEMVTGKTPWADKNYDNEMNAILDIGMSQETPTVPEELPESLKEFLQLCLVRDPEKRSSAEQLMQSKFVNQ